MGNPQTEQPYPNGPEAEQKPRGGRPPRGWSGKPRTRPAPLVLWKRAHPYDAPPVDLMHEIAAGRAVGVVSPTGAWQQIFACDTTVFGER